MKVSSAKGKAGSKKQAQKHQNSFAFVPCKHSPAAQKIASLPTRGLCQRCHDMITWKKQMQRYKPLTQPKTCTQCSGRTIRDAYHVICQPCAAGRNVCAKCLQEKTLIKDPKDQRREQDEAERQENEHCMSFLNERQKRTFMRRIERGYRDSAIAFANAVDKRSPDFDFEGFEDDEDDFSENEEEEDGDEEDSSSLAAEEEIES